MPVTMSDFEKISANLMPEKEYSGKGAVDIDQESNGSSSMDEMESPRSVAKVMQGKYWNRKKINVYVHSQILRIRTEDSRVGDDIRLGENCVAHVMVFSRPILPASPLGAKTVAFQD